MPLMHALEKSIHFFNLKIAKNFNTPTRHTFKLFVDSELDMICTIKVNFELIILEEFCVVSYS